MMSDRSNSASAPMMWKTRRPPADFVSMFCSATAVANAMLPIGVPSSGTRDRIATRKLASPGVRMGLVPP